MKENTQTAGNSMQFQSAPLSRPPPLRLHQYLQRRESIYKELYFSFLSSGGNPKASLGGEQSPSIHLPASHPVDKAGEAAHPFPQRGAFVHTHTRMLLACCCAMRDLWLYKHRWRAERLEMPPCKLLHGQRLHLGGACPFLFSRLNVSNIHSLLAQAW